MSLPRRSFSFSIKKQNDKVTKSNKFFNLNELPVKQEITGKSHYKDKKTADNIERHALKLSRKNSVSTSLIHELRESRLYIEQKNKLEHRKSRSSESLIKPRKVLDINLNKEETTKVHNNQTLEKRKSTSFSDLSPKTWTNFEIATVNNLVDSRTCRVIVEKSIKMNFFGSTGYLNITEAKLKENSAEVTVNTKSLHSSEEDLEDRVQIGTGVSKYGSLSRRQKLSQPRKNRKHNADFRSVWYDEDEFEQDDFSPATTKGSLSATSQMRKAISLDNLLDGNNKPQLRKSMISSPLRPRRIFGNWTDKRDIVATVEEHVLENNYSVSADNSYINDSIDVAVAAENFFQNNFKSTDNIYNTSEIPSVIDDLEKNVLENSIIVFTSDRSETVSIDHDKENSKHIVNSDINCDASSPIVTAETMENPNTAFKLSDINDKLINKEHGIRELSGEVSLPITKSIDVSTSDQNISTEAAPKEIINEEAKKDISSPDVINRTSEAAESNYSLATAEDMSNKEKTEKLAHPETILYLMNNPDVKRRRKNILKSDISSPILLTKKEENAGDVSTDDSVDTAGFSNLLRMKSKSKSTNELLKSFNQIKNEKLEQSNDPKFPIPESEEIEEEVSIRRHQNINQYRYSKTTDFDFGRKHSNKDFEIKACTKIIIPNETSPFKLKKKELIKYQNGHFYRIYEDSKKLLRANVILKSARLLNKRDVELRDSNNLTYIVFFESSKDAKLFVENEKVSCYIDNDNKSTITKTLLRLLGKRSSREVLEKKGIYQNEPIFGNTLRNIYSTEKAVPEFILKTMELIERPDNITSLGLYRTSGNLATIQKIRFEVDKGRLGILNEYGKDVDVLTGCLKLFFRELKEPLIPCDICDSLLNITKHEKNYSKKDREKIKAIIRSLPESNSETLYVLIKHLAEVVKYKNENKMDTYNLSICWGPTIIFITEDTLNSNGKDIVTQSTDATRLFDALLRFYIENPEELEFIKKRQDYMESPNNTIQRHNSKESIKSIDSNNSKVQKKDSSNSSLNIDEMLKKSIELIESNIGSEGLYKKSGSTEKINKIIKKMTRKKVNELEKYKHDTHELTDSLKKYLRELPEPLATHESVQQVIKFCDNMSCLEQSTRHKIVVVIEDLPKKDVLIYLLQHIIKVVEHEPYHKVSKPDMVSIWTNVLNYQKRITESNEIFSHFLEILLDVFDETKPDVPTPSKGMMNGLLNDLKNYQKDKDRCSKYDNVPELETDNFKKVTVIEEKTEEQEYTKL